MSILEGETFSCFKNNKVEPRTQQQIKRPRGISCGRPGTPYPEQPIGSSWLLKRGCEFLRALSFGKDRAQEQSRCLRGVPEVAKPQSCGGPRVPCPKPCAKICCMCVCVCHEGIEKFLKELDANVVGIKDEEKAAMAKMWNKEAPNCLKCNFCHQKNRLKIKIRYI